MPTCENCNNQWSWKQTVKKTTTLNPAMTCPYCGEKQYQTQKSKNQSIFLMVIITLLITLIPKIFDMSIPAIIGLYLILIAIVFLAYPYLVKLNSTEKYINFFKNK